jgi:hypothetical protein
MTPPGWFHMPGDDKELLRWWDGQQWTGHVQVNTQAGEEAGFGAGLIALALIGSVMAIATSVSVLSGTTTVWIGAAIAAACFIVALVWDRVPTWAMVTCLILAIASVASAGYDEYQVQKRINELQRFAP